MCGSCHRGAFEASHPTGFWPNRPLPADFPLESSGQMTCVTCHDLQDSGRIGLRGAAAANAGQELCLSCHEEGFFAAMADGGLSLVRRGHLDARAERRPQSIDPYSMQCAQCHEENVSLAGDTFRVPLRIANSTGMANHPIGSDYARAAAGRGYRPAAMFAGEVLLADGKVSCVSCHQGYSREHGALVMRETELCLTCHDM